MNNMFYGCISLISIKLTNLSAPEANSMDYMLYKCTSLE